MPSSERAGSGAAAGLERLLAYDGLIFDLDGTLVDSMHLHLAAWKHAAQRHGFAFDHATYHAWGGIPSPKVARLINERQGLALDPEAVAATKAEHYLRHIGEVRPIAATLEVIASVHGRLPMAVATGTPRANLERILGATGLAAYFRATVCAEDVERHKPHPDTFLLAAERLGVAARGCLVFEDTLTGFDAAAAAGMDCVPVEAAEIRWDGLRPGCGAGRPGACTSGPA
jgi:beta-phosphoglucomutase family hydrolase